MLVNIFWIDIIFINSTCFDDQLMLKLGEKAVAVRSGCRIVTLTRPLIVKNFHDFFDISFQTQYSMSWGEATCFIHIRKWAYYKLLFEWIKEKNEFIVWIISIFN